MKRIFKVICCGNVDDGKSTLLGRLLFETGSIKQDQLEEALASSIKTEETAQPDFAMFLDGLAMERTKKITVDVAHRYFTYNQIRFHVLDCPGHEEYTKNMATAAACADSALIVVDATRPIRAQTIRHIEICAMFRLKQVCICLTKYDLLADKSILKQKEEEIRNLLKDKDFSYTIFPISAVTGYNIPKVLSVLENFAEQSANIAAKNQTIIFHIQAMKQLDGKCYIYGKNLMNRPIDFAEGETFTVYPTHQELTVSAESASLPLGCIQPTESIDVNTGDCVANCPLLITNKFSHQTIFFEEPGNHLLLKHGTKIVRVVQLTDTQIQTDAPLFINNIEDIKENGFGILIDEITKKTIGCCVFTRNHC